MNRYCAVAIAAVFLMGGCAPKPSVTRLSNVPYQPTSADQVQLVTVPPARPFIELGIIEVRGLPNENVAKLPPRARKAAANLGAHAVILQMDSERLPGTIYQNHAYPGMYHTLPGGRVPILRGVAIRFSN